MSPDVTVKRSTLEVLFTGRAHCWCGQVATRTVTKFTQFYCDDHAPTFAVDLQYAPALRELIAAMGSAR